MTDTSSTSEMPSQINPPLLETNFDDSLAEEVNDSEISPWDPSKIRITTKHFSVRELVEQIEEEEIDLAPDFQRAYLWDELQRTRLVESILLGIPLPTFYFNQNDDGSMQVVDGVQRLTSIKIFMENKHVLRKKHLEYLVDLDNLTYDQLDAKNARRFKATQLVVHITEPSTPDEIKYNIFSRVNTLGRPLKSQQIRHAMSKQPSRELLKSLVSMNEFDEATNFYFYDKVNKSHHCLDMADRELALRFCAFYITSVSDYQKSPNLDKFLIEFNQRLDGKASESFGDPLDEIDRQKLKKVFKIAMINAKKVLGIAAFRRYETQSKRRHPLNRAIFESQAIALSKYPVEQVEEKAQEIKNALIGLFNDQDYLKAVTVSTGSSKAVKTRIEKPQLLLRKIMS